MTTAIVNDGPPHNQLLNPNTTHSQPMEEEVPRISIDAEFQSLIPALRLEELKQLEANIVREGCQEPLSVWQTDGKTILLDGHNRFAICEKHGVNFETVPVEVADRNHAKLWIGERQLGRRNLTDDQRSIIANEVRENKSAIEKKERGSKGRASVRSRNPVNPDLQAKSAHKSENPKKPTRTTVAVQSKLPERKLRLVQQLKKTAPDLVEKVRSGELSLVDAVKLSRLSNDTRKLAVDAIQSGTDLRSALRTARKNSTTM